MHCCVPPPKPAAIHGAKQKSSDTKSSDPVSEPVSVGFIYAGHAVLQQICVQQCALHPVDIVRNGIAGDTVFCRNVLHAAVLAAVEQSQHQLILHCDLGKMRPAPVLLAISRIQCFQHLGKFLPGDAEGKGGVYNFVTKRGHCKGINSKLSWTQVETGSAITWKYPSCILSGDNSTAEFYSVAVTNNYQQADTGTKMIHLGKNTRSTIVSKGISAGRSENSYRGLVRVAQKADNARNYSQCDSLLLGDKCGAHTFPYMDIHNETAIVEHEATTSKISEDQIFYCNQRGISTEDAIGLIVNGYAKEVLNKLPMEFAVEAQKLLAISLEGSVG